VHTGREPINCLEHQQQFRMLILQNDSNSQAVCYMAHSLPATCSVCVQGINKSTLKLEAICFPRTLVATYATYCRALCAVLSSLPPLWYLLFLGYLGEQPPTVLTSSGTWMLLFQIRSRHILSKSRVTVVAARLTFKYPPNMLQ
jgi:hypothetical protein